MCENINKGGLTQLNVRSKNIKNQVSVGLTEEEWNDDKEQGRRRRRGGGSGDGVG